MIKLYTSCLVLLIENLIVGQAVITLKIVKYDTYLVALKLTIFEVTNLSLAPPKVIYMFSLVFINNYATFKVVRI